MPSERRDELGPIPDDVAVYLAPHTERGFRAAVARPLNRASGLILIVPQAQSASAVPGTGWIPRTARHRRLPMIVCDSEADGWMLTQWLGQLPAVPGGQRIVVTGPRATRWTGGERATPRLLSLRGC